MDLIEEVTVGAGGASSITFMSVGSIPSEYTDLLLKLSLRASLNGDNQLLMTFNSSSSGYSFRRLRGDGSAASSYAESSQSRYNGYGHLTNPSENTASTFSSVEIYIPNYRSGVAKSFSVDAVTENNGTAAFQIIVAGLWSGTDPITSIQLSPALTGTGSLFVQYSSASLYGILAGSDGTTAVS